jgi:hypothetical protein
MRFYYVSLFSLILLGLIYVFGTMFLVWLGKTLRKRWDGAWKLMVPLFALLYIGPIAEEPWIAWNFGQSCKKDAGIFVYKTVEVDGFYDAAAVLPRVYDPLAPQSVEYYEKGGYRYYELGLSQPSGDPNKVVHIEKVEGVWTPTVLDRPTARYHYKELASHLPVSHQVKKFERVVVDQQTQDVLGRYLIYYRGAPWFFIGLDRPTIPCVESRDSWTEGRSMMVWQSVLLPKK